MRVIPSFCHYYYVLYLSLNSCTKCTVVWNTNMNWSSVDFQCLIIIVVWNLIRLFRIIYLAREAVLVGGLKCLLVGQLVGRSATHQIHKGQVFTCWHVLEVIKVICHLRILVTHAVKTLRWYTGQDTAGSHTGANNDMVVNQCIFDTWSTILGSIRGISNTVIVSECDRASKETHNLKFKNFLFSCHSKPCWYKLTCMHTAMWTN